MQVLFGSPVHEPRVRTCVNTTPPVSELRGFTVRSRGGAPREVRGLAVDPPRDHPNGRPDPVGDFCPLVGAKDASRVSTADGVHIIRSEALVRGGRPGRAWTMHWGFRLCLFIFCVILRPGCVWLMFARSLNIASRHRRIRGGRSSVMKCRELCISSGAGLCIFSRFRPKCIAVCSEQVFAFSRSPVDCSSFIVHLARSREVFPCGWWTHTCAQESFAPIFSPSARTRLRLTLPV